MPTIYKGTCITCGYETMASDGVAVISRNGQVTRQDVSGDELIHLPHPGESSAIAKLGDSFGSASREGRLVAIQHVCCRRCGTLYELRKTIFGSSELGCGIALGLLAVGLAISILLSHLIGLAIAVGGILGMELWQVTYRTWRFPRRRWAFDHRERCPKCQANEPSNPADGINLPCPQCGKPTLRFTPWGIS